MKKGSADDFRDKGTKPIPKNPSANKPVKPLTDDEKKSLKKLGNG